MADKHYKEHYNAIGHVIVKVIMNFEHMNDEWSHTVGLFTSRKLTVTQVRQGSANVKHWENISLQYVYR